MSRICRLAAGSLIAVFAMFLLSSGAFADPANPISVTVDNQPIQFTEAQPTEVDGSVLVPLRGVFDALHAEVDYDASDNTITATRGSRVVVVPIGSPTATINGQQEPLSQPAQIVDNTTMVPLRFVAEALGDYVQWSSDTQTVAITREATDNSGMAPVPSPAPRMMHYRGNVVEGTLARIVTNDGAPRIDIRSFGQEQSIVLTPDAIISRGLNRADAQSVNLYDLHPGDHVWVGEDDNGHAARITAIYGQNGQ